MIRFLQPRAIGMVGVLGLAVLVLGLVAVPGGWASGTASADAPAPILSGDVDCSGAVNAVDALKVLRSVASLPVEYPEGCVAVGNAVLSADDVNTIVNNKLNTLDRSLALWNIQPGLGTVMIEYATRFNNMWFAAQAGNWEMVKYQIDEMTEIQEVAEVTRPNRAPALINFEDTYLTPLMGTTDPGDLAAFTTAYDNAIDGCNQCHAGSSNPTFSSFDFVKITRPTETNFHNVDWAGQ